MVGRVEAVVTPLLLVFAVCLVAAAVLTGVVRRYAMSRSILDMPTDRSSHITPTPRGGGLAIASVTLVGVAIGAFAGLVPKHLAVALVGGGVLVATVGWLDDRRGVRPGARILVQAAAAAWALVWLGGLPAVRFGTAQAALGHAGIALGAFVILWGINLYNFMDGIDGLAGGEAVVVGGSAAGLLYLTGHPGLAWTAATLGGASGGFLLWNWPPAKIFLGDVGSGFLGFSFAVLAIASENMGGPPLIAWILLLGVFVFDASVTLLRRVLKGERVYEAHRRHAYQRAIQAGWSHGWVTGTALVLSAMLSLLVLAGIHAPERFGAMLLAGIGILGLTYIVIERWQPMWDAVAVSGKPREHGKTNGSLS